MLHGQLHAVRIGGQADLNYAAKAFEHFQCLVLKKLYGRNWRRRRDCFFRWFGQTELHDKRGRRCALHVHSRLEACALGRPIGEVETLIVEAWQESATKFFLYVPEIDVQWIISTSDAEAVDTYIRKRTDNPTLRQPPVGHRTMLKASKPTRPL